VRYVDVAALLDGTLPEPPAPDLLRRSDSNALFYAGQVNLLFGDPESGKTWVALAAVEEALHKGGTALVVDLDHNGPAATLSRLVALGAPSPRCETRRGSCTANRTTGRRFWPSSRTWPSGSREWL
jgi:hypothetical protein